MPSVERACVNVDIHNGIAWVNLNRPKKKNAMSPQLHEEMDATLVELEFDNNVKAIVISGAGGNFSAGQDLKEFFERLRTTLRAASVRKTPPTGGGGTDFICTASRPFRWSRAIVPVVLSCSSWRQTSPWRRKMRSFRSRKSTGALFRGARRQSCRRRCVVSACSLLRLPRRALRWCRGRACRLCEQGLSQS